MGDVVNVSVVVKLVTERYTRENYSFWQRDRAVSNTDWSHCPVPIPGQYDDFILSALMLSPVVSHYFSIVLIVFCVRCQMTPVSLPSASVTRSSANAWRLPGMFLAENLSRSSTTRFHRNGERMPPWEVGTTPPDPDPLSYDFVSYCEVTMLDHVDNPSIGGFVYK